MSLDGAFLRITVNELAPLINSRVDKVYQPSKEEIVLALRSVRGGQKVVLSANGASARAGITKAEFENPAKPPMFCMLLRKHLSGGRLKNIRQDGLERIVYFDFECLNEIGDIVTNTLICEIMGRHSNIILVRDGKIIDSIKHITDEISSVRRVLPGAAYETPPRPERLCFLDCSAEEILEKTEGSPEKLAKKLMSVLEGISPIFARECAYYAAKDADIACNELSESAKDKVKFFLNKAKSAVSSGKGDFTIVSDLSGKKKDFCFLNIEQYSTAMLISKSESACALLDEFFASRDRVERTKQRAGELLKFIINAYERVSRRVELQKKELSECAGRDEYKKCGDIINANIYRLKKGLEKAELPDFYTGELRVIKLDPRLTPAQNAQKYYKEYRKLDTAEKKLKELIVKGGEELSYLDSVFDAASRTESESDISEIRGELREMGYLHSAGKAYEKTAKASAPLEYTASDGFEILVGRNNRQNDKLTLKTAKPNDIWLHTQGIAGSHVIIRTNGKTPGEQTLTEAAEIAAYNSKGRSSSGVPVDYTLVKFVKKPAGAKPGMVIFTNNRTLYVTPDEEKINRLKGRKKQQ